MQSGLSSTHNGQKVIGIHVINTSLGESRPPSRYLTLNDILSQPAAISRHRARSKIYTGLTSKIEKRILTADPHRMLHEAVSPNPTTTKSIIHLENGIRLRKMLTTSKHGYGRVKKDRNRGKEAQTLLQSDGFAEFFSPYTPFRDSFLIIRKSELAMTRDKYQRKLETSPVSCTHARYKPLRMQESSPTAQPRPTKKSQLVPLKVAIRDKDWIAKARPQIIVAFCSYMNRSNGMLMQVPADSYFTYKYYLGKGNNSKLVHQCLGSRWWWTRVSEEEKENAHLVWTQWRDKEFVETLERVNEETYIDSLRKISIATNVRYFDAESKPKLVDISPLGFDLIFKSKQFAGMQCRQYSCSDFKMHNKIEHNFHLSNKKGLFFNMKIYYEAIGRDIFEVLPVTFHIKHSEDQNFIEFEKCFNDFAKQTDEFGKNIANLWIVKPGENSNRGSGISICNTLDQIKLEIKNNQMLSTGPHTFIIQKYLENPFLVNKRKFDIRCYALVTCYNGVLQAYYFTEGYLRTTSKNFTLLATNKFVHLTNDAVQKYSEDYGKFENGNKMSYTDFQRYLDSHYTDHIVNFLEEVVPEIKEIIADTIKAVYFKLDPNRRAHTFELFGYDFLLDSELRPWLLEVNTNPCLELSSPHLARIIPSLIENTLRICVDPIFQEPASYVKHYSSINELAENKFELIFHSATVEAGLIQKIKEVQGRYDVCDFAEEDLAQGPE